MEINSLFTVPVMRIDGFMFATVSNHNSFFVVVQTIKRLFAGIKVQIKELARASVILR